MIILALKENWISLFNSIYFIPIFNIYLISIFLSITVRLDQKRNKNHRIIEKQYVTIIYYIFNWINRLF